MEPLPQTAVRVLRSRLTPQIPRVGTVSRRALVDRIRRASDKPLVAVIAPAGYGKTTLLAQWAEQDPRPFAWVSFDRIFNDPAVLLTYLSFAVGGVIRVGRDVFEGLVAPHPPDRSSVLAGLASSIANSEQPFVLLLDDIHLLADAEGIEAVKTIVEHLPEGSQVGIAARQNSSLGLARMRSEGRVLDVGMQELRFDSSEAVELLAANGAELPEEALSTLISRTDGWPVALYLAAVANDPREFPEARGRSFTGDDRLLADYIRSEFLEQLEPDAVRFLIHSSVLDELSGPLCDATLERSGSQSLLEEFEASNLLLVPLDRQRRWYRYHPLFQDMLHSELDRLEPGAVRALAVRASEWCAEQGLLDSAVHYAQLAGDATRVGQILLQHAMRQYALGRATAVRDWFAWLAQHDGVDGTVAVMGAWLHLLSGDATEAGRWAAVADRAPQDVVLSDGSTLAAWTSTLHAAMAPDVDETRSAAERSLRLLAPNSQWRATAAFLLGSAELCEGSLDAADLHLQDAVELGAALGGTPAASSALAARAIIAMRWERWQDALALVDRAWSLITGAHLETYSATALSHVARARVAVHHGELRAASEAAEAAERLLPLLTRALAHLAILTRLELVRAYLELGDARAAAAKLGEVDDLLRIPHGFGALPEEAGKLATQAEELRSLALGAQKLTPAELRLLPYLATQLSFREIAEQFFVSFHTVRTQVTSIYAKLNVSSRTQAIQRARSVGLLPD